MTETNDSVDVAVVGGGACGMTAALRAARNPDIQVAVFEKSTRHGCNTQISSGSLAAGGTRFQEAAGVKDSSDKHAADILAVSRDPGAAPLVRAVCEAAPRYVEWLADVLGHPMEIGLDMPRSGQSVPRLHTDPGRSGGMTLVRTLRRAIEAAPNIAFVDHTSGTGLVTEEQEPQSVRVTGVVTGETAVSAREVVLATDGFGNNPGLVAKYCPAGADAVYCGVSTSTGDGLTWGLSAGAAVRNMGGYLGHGLVVVGHGTRLNPNFPFLGALLVDGSGRRFCDEKAQGYSKLGQLLRGLPGARAALIWDGPAMEIARHSELMRESVAAGAYGRYESVRELAAGLKLPEAALAETIASFPASSDLVVRDGERLRGPLYGAWVTYGLLTTQGGLLIDTSGRVLRANGTAIPGLSAGGGTANGISGDSPDGYMSGNGLLAAMGLGWIIGNRLAMSL
ncbi:MAG TPA: FAD-binding protein [Trebonia sp.]|jgi:fumarate reductase flavoprotein subunit